jgi:sulfur relay (sulfurtransferase) complex TusBCD TusD component (DsrE family)
MALNTTDSRGQHWNLALVATGPPDGSDSVTTMLRLADAALRKGASVLIWACGYNTMLTQRSLGAVKPRDLTAWDRVHPTSAAIIGGLLAAYPTGADHGGLAWYVCRFCARDRGAGEHIDGTSLKYFSQLRGYLERSATTLWLGGA